MAVFVYVGGANTYNALVRCTVTKGIDDIASFADTTSQVTINRSMLLLQESEKIPRFSSHLLWCASSALHENGCEVRLFIAKPLFRIRWRPQRAPVSARRRLLRR